MLWKPVLTTVPDVSSVIISAAYGPFSRAPSLALIKLLPQSARSGRPPEEERLTYIDTAHGESTHRRPLFLPDGRRFLYLSRSDNPQSDGIYLSFLDKRLACRRPLSDFYPNKRGRPV